MNNEPAFPVSTIDGFTQHGMSLRDYIACQVVPAPLVSATGLGEASKEERAVIFRLLAQISYEIADAMIEARSAKSE